MLQVKHLDIKAQNINRIDIESEIYTTFKSFKNEKNIKIADFLNKLNLKEVKNVNYRKIKFNYESLLKLILFQKLKGIRFHTKLTKYLRRNPSEKFKLGFSRTPDRRTIGYFLHCILDAETKEQLDFIATKIEEISEKFGILLDVKTLQPEKPKKQTKSWNKYHLKNKKTKEICKLFKKRFSPFIDLNLNYLYKEYLNKPIHLEELRRVIKKALEEHSKSS